MARGLILGATLLAFTGFLFSLMVALVPMWLAFRTEVEERMCFKGDGIFKTNYFYGQDLPSIFMECAGETRSTYDAYCGPDPTPTLNDRDPVNYADDMCTATNRAKVTSIITIFLTFFTALVGCVLEMIPLNSQIEVYLSLTGFLLCGLSIISSMLTGVFMLTSPLFSDAHIDALSKESAGIPYSSFFSCSFQMPLHSIWSLVFPGALECIFPGPALIGNALLLMMMGLSGCFYGISTYHVYTKKFAHIMDVGHHFHHQVPVSDEEKGRKQRIYSLFGAAARKFSWLSPLMRNLLIVGLPYIVMLSNAVVWFGFIMTGVQVIVGARVYIGRFDGGGSSHHHATWYDDEEQNVNQLSLASLRMAAANTKDMAPSSSFEFLSAVASLPLSLLMDSVVHHPSSSSSAAAPGLVHLPQVYTRPANKYESIPLTHPLSIQLQSLLNISSSSNQHSLSRLDNLLPLTLFRDTVNVFNFSPTTSLSYFWNGGAYFVAFATFVAVFLVPIVKVLIWIWYYYVPSDEVWRGRILTFQDFVGKYMLAQILIIGWMGVAIAVKREIVLPAILFLGILPPGTALRIHLVIGLNLGDGLGSWLFVLTVVLSLFVGQFALTFHQRAFYWEEDRRVANAQAKRYRDMGLSGGGSIGGGDVLLSPYGSSDTPYTASSTMLTATPGGPLQSTMYAGGQPVTSSSLAGGGGAIPRAGGGGGGSGSDLTRPLLRAIVEFGSSANLAGMAANNASTTPARSASDHRLGSGGGSGGGANNSASSSAAAAATQRELRQPIINRIAQFGSRTNLANLSTIMVPHEEDMHHALTTTTTTIVATTTNNNPNQRATSGASFHLDKPMHPLVEAMCDRVQSPMHGVRLRWTIFGKALMLFFLFCLAGLTLASLSYEVCEIKREGVIEYVTVPISEWKQSYSIISLTQKVGNAGYNAKGYEQQVIYVLFLILVPMARLLMLAYLWLLPLTISQQKAMFDTLEIASAWSSLDVFWVVMIIMDVELEKITHQLTALQTPKVAKLLEFFFGGIIPGGFLGAQIKLLPGFWLLTAVVVLEKLVFYMVTEQTVTAISERQAETLLRELALADAAAANATSGAHHHADGMWSGDSRPRSRGPLDTIHETPNTMSSPYIDQMMATNHLIADATEGLLETNAALFFSPAARYTFAPKTFYSGLPRFVWAKWFVSLGLLADADRVYMYGSASPASSITHTTTNNNNVSASPPYGTATTSSTAGEGGPLIGNMGNPSGSIAGHDIAKVSAPAPPPAALVTAASTTSVPAVTVVPLIADNFALNDTGDMSIIGDGSSRVMVAAGDSAEGDDMDDDGSGALTF